MDNDAVLGKMVSALQAWAESEGFPGLNWMPYAETLLPVVREISAEELREAAKAIYEDSDSHWSHGDVLKARALALAKPPGPR